MKVSPIYNATLLQIIAKRKEITYAELKKEYCVPVPSKVISRELMKEIYGLDCQIIEDPVSGTPLIVPEGRYHKEAQNEKSFCA